MTSRERDELLWEMGRMVGGENSGSMLGREDLIAYREGRLSAAEASELEKILSETRAVRAHLAELAELDGPRPSPAAREAVLAAYDAARQPRLGRLWLAAAAVLALGIGLFLLTAGGPAPLPTDLAFDVEAVGLATVRGAAVGAHQIVAYPETWVRITARPRPRAVAGIEFGLYRSSGDRLSRLPLAPGAQLESNRGAAFVKARAADLTTAAEATTLLFLVAARTGDLPPQIFAAPGETRSAIEMEGRRRAYPIEVRVLESDEPDPDRALSD